MGGWRWAVVSPDGVALIRMVDVSASVNLSMHHKVQKFSYGTGSPGWCRKKGCKTVVVWCRVHNNKNLSSIDMNMQRMQMTLKSKQNK